MAELFVLNSLVTKREEDDEDLEENGRKRKIMQILVSAISVMERSPRHRIRGFARDTVECYRDDEFRKLYRMYKDTARKFIQELERVAEENRVVHLCKRDLNGGRPQIPLETKALILLFYMSSNCSYNIVATLFGVSESTACHCVHAILEVMNEHMRDTIIKWPSQEELDMISDSIYQSKGFRGVVGFIDGTHIPIQQPRERGMDYFNRKDFYSIILQAVVREDLRFVNVYVGWPGRVHDARVFAESPLAAQGRDLCGDRHILGDPAYPCLSWLITPFKRYAGQPLTPEKEHFNKVHSTIRVQVERAFGQLKARFQRLRPLYQTEVELMAKTIVVACILHNICVLANDSFEDEEEDQAPAQIVENVDNMRGNLVFTAADRAAGNAKRLDIAAELVRRLQ